MSTAEPGRVFVGVDGSQASIRALLWTRALGLRAGWSVAAVMAWDPSARRAIPGGESPPTSEEGMERAVAAVLEGIVADAHLEDVSCLPLRGPARQALLQVTERPDATAVVVGSRGLGPVDGLLLGSVSRWLLFTARCPLILVPPSGAKAGFDRIVVGLDGSPISRDTAAWSARLCTDLGVAATVVQCVDPGAEYSTQRLQEIMAGYQSELAGQLCRELRDQGIAHDAVVMRGDPRRCLVEVAEETGAGLIVIGRHGRGNFEGLGGTASYLVRHSPLPLAIVPPGIGATKD